MRFSLQAKLLLMALLLATLPLVLASAFAVRWFAQDRESFLFQLSGFAAGAAARESDRNLSRMADELGKLALVAGDVRLSPEERSRLAGQLFSGSGLVAVTATAAGRELLAIEDRERLTQLGAATARLQADPAKAPRDGAVLVRNVTVEARAPMLSLSRLVPVAGASPIAIDALFPASEALDPTAWSAPFETYLIDLEGNLLAHPDAARLEKHEEVSSLEVVRKLREGGQGATGYETPAGRVLGAYAPVHTGRLGVVLQVPESSVTEAIEALVRNAAILVLAVLAAAILAAALLARGIARPVAALTGAAEALAKGDFEAALPPAGSDEVGTLTRAFGQMRSDLGERERQLREAQESLVQSEKMGALGQLAAGITHEVKNPLAGIIGYAQLVLKQTPPDSPTVKHLELIEREGKRSKDILENLLRFARKEELELEEADLSNVVVESIKLTAHQLQLNKIKLEQKLAPGLPTIKVNATQLQQVFLNLILNAMHAMQPKGGVLEVATGLAPDGRVIASFKDEGHGIKEEHRRRLFTPFFTTKGKGQGTGLGLSVSYGIVKDHGGELKVWSQEGVGTIFYVYLPVAASAEESAEEEEFEVVA